MKQKVWETANYYKQARQASFDLYHPGLQLIKQQAVGAKKILEVGCGEGTKLANLTGKNSQVFGIDISSTAIKIAKKQYPDINFRVADGDKLPFDKQIFDLVYSAFTLEHVDNPEKIIKEMVRVLKIKGKLILLAPNFGAPNRASPCFSGNRSKKLIIGFMTDWLNYFSRSKKLAWHKVKPIALPREYQIDWDTTIEPYLGTLKSFLQNCGMKIIFASSLWSQVSKDKKNFGQKLFSFLSKLNIYPFINWGPHLVVYALKNKKGIVKF